MAREIITGIDIGSSIIRILTLEKRKDQTINILSAIQRPSEGIKRGFVSDTNDATKSISLSIKSAEKAAAVPIKEVILGISGIGLSSIKSKGSVMIAKADGEVTENDIKRAIEQSEANLPHLANRRIIHEIPLNYKIDNNLVWGKPNGMIGSKLEIETLFITCLNQHLSDIIKCVESAGVSIEDIIAAPLAMAEALLNKNQKEVGCVLANIGSNTVSIVVFEEGLPISLEVFPLGSNNITTDIALGFQVGLEEAEKMKINYGKDNVSSRRKLEDIIEARLDDIFEIIKNHLKKINREEMLPGGIILTGGGSSLFSLEEMARSELNLPAKIGIPSNSANNIIKSITSNSNSIKDLVLNDPAWSTVLGLCMTKIKDEKNPSIADGNVKNISSNIIKNTIRWFKNLIP